MTKKSSELNASQYVHLHNHTQYSLLDGLTKVDDLVDLVSSSGMRAVAMTDHGTLSGAIEFYKAAKDQNIKPIIGIETYVAARKHTDKDPQKDKNRFHLIVLAMNMTGYQNLMRLSTIANLDGYYYFPRIDHDLLEKYNEGLIVLSACMGGEVGNAFGENRDKDAEDIALWYKKVFGDRYYLEVQDHGHPKNSLHSAEQQAVNEKVLALGKKLDIPAVVTCDAHYLKHEDQEAHEVLLCVGTGAYLSDTKRMSLKEFPLHVTDPNEIIERWGKDYPELITNTKAIADRCELELDLGKILIPKFPVPGGETEKSYLDKLVYQGLAFRYGGVTEDSARDLSIAAAKKLLSKDILKRAEYELGVIDSMNFNGYFLIIWDFIKWGKDSGIVFGPGRGSAAGSIISYALKITDLDPIKHDLLFERFLNPDRISMPDIDIDIQDSRRDEVIKYCVEKYGTDRVANIVTFGRMAARAAVRDVARVLQVPYNEADRLAKMIPPPIQGRHTPLAKTLQENDEIRAEYNNNPNAKQVFDMAIRLEGTVRSHGVHAAGVVIAPDDIVKFVPLEMAQKGVVSTQYPMGPIEEIGLLKMDFLGLSNLTTIKNALRIIKKVYNADIDINSLPLDDKKTYKLFQRGDTTGIFQFESSGMKRYLRELKPTVFDDIIAMGALYRPGPLTAGLTDKFIARKNGRESVSYDHKLMEPALKDTYGVMVYQEQFMQIVRDMCDFSGGESDTLRKAVGKKKRDLMAKMKNQVIDGAVNKGVDKKIVEKFWSDLEGFADYAFNKSHAACYGLIAYWTAYLKAHYPAAFMAALMTSDFDNTDRLAIEISECKHMNIKVLAPDVNESFHEFAVVPHTNKEPMQVRFGMDAVKNVGHGAVAEIIRARDEDGQFGSLTDFVARVNSRLVNKKVWESLIKSGAFDRFGERGVLLDNVDNILAAAAKLHKEQISGQTDLFGDGGETSLQKVTINIPSGGSQYSEHDYLQWERELLGLYLSNNPLEAFEQLLSEQAVPLAQVTTDNDNKTISVGGTINSIRQITTKNGQPMAFVKIEDMAGDERELVIFPNTFKETTTVWSSEKIIIATGRINATDQSGTVLPEPKILVESARVITPDDAKAYKPNGSKPSLLAAKARPRKAAPAKPITQEPESEVPQRLYIKLKDASDADMLAHLKTLLDNHTGSHEAVLVLGESKRQIIKLPQKVTNDENLLQDLETLVGAGHVKFQ